MSDNTNKNFWDRFAKIYAAFMAKNNSTYEKMTKELERYVDLQKKVLELACGTGQITFSIADKVEMLEATDYAENMIKEAQKRNEVEFKRRNIHFCVQDATNLTYEDESFDVVVIANALHIMPDPDKALREIRRVLKQGGILFAPTFVYEKGYSRLLISFMEKAGFKTFHKWEKDELERFVCNRGFRMISTTLLKGKPLAECVFVGKKADD